MQIPVARVSMIPAVTVDTPARLHLGFLDPNGSLGRTFGSLGVAIDSCGTRIAMRATRQRTRVAGDVGDAQRERIERYVERLRAQWGGPSAEVSVERAPRAHTGLGSGTQLALAIGTAFARLSGRLASTAEIAGMLDRGARSGIGILAFEHGGVLVDGGHRACGASGTNADAHAPMPPLLFRQPFPDAWRILLVDDLSRNGLHGDAERRGIAALPPFPQALAAHLCHLLVMRILPGLAEPDFDAFARGVTELQHCIGEYFAPVQGGVFTSAGVAAALDAVSERHVAGIGQSSWGPTGFAILKSAEEAERALALARDASRGHPSIACSIVTGRNRGATLRPVDLHP